MTEHEPEFAQDLLLGADQIAEFLYGDRKLRRKVYHLVATSNWPVFFKLGSQICARKSVILKWVDQAERRAAESKEVLPLARAIQR